MEHPVHTYLAHISEDGTRTQTVYEHLSGTAKIAGAFAASFDAQAEAEYTAWYHDVGKLSNGFQLRLKGGHRVDHSTAGAQLAFQQYHRQAAFAIAGHHSGLPDGGNCGDDAGDATLFGRSKKTVELCDGWQELPIPDSTPPAWANTDPLNCAFFTRMLYSCLVDADFIDTETFMDGKAAPRGGSADIAALRSIVSAQAERYLSAASPSPVSVQRNTVLRACLDTGAHGAQGLYTLTVPTGGGKTFASLAFALEHAAAQKMKRVIYVIPYMSIIDQTAAVFSDLLGEENVLADFSNAEYKTVEQDDLTPAQYRQMLASENWDAPVVVTTAVQFFESLYANRSSRCRKLHNIADSVIIFDEAQTLPVDYLAPCISAISQLIQHYHATAVLCTATQPALEPLFRRFAPELHPQEITPDTGHLYEVLRRTTLQDLGTLPLDAFAARLAQHPQVLCVVNRRKTAQQLYAALPAEGSYCLTTLLCAADRRRQLDDIRQRLKDGLPCRVVSTSLIEAGVDVDFPTAYRELCGLDSLLQTAGRCNREGRRTAEESIVYRFQLEEYSTPRMLAQNVSALNYAARYQSLLDTPKSIKAYFEKLFDLRGVPSDLSVPSAIDKHGILGAFLRGIQGCSFPFAQVAAEFHLIENAARTIYLPIGEGKALCEQLQNGHVTRTLLRKLGIYSVSCYKDQFEKLDAAGALTLLPDGSAILTDTSHYNSKTGLDMDVETGIGLYF